MRLDYQIKFTFEDIRFLEPIKEDWQIVTRVESNFFIYVNNKILYQDAFFNVGEFAISVSKWLEKIQTNAEDYYFETIDAEEKGLVWFKQKNGKWQIGSIYQEYEEMYLFNLAEIEETSNNFLIVLLNYLPKHIAKRVKRMLKTKNEW